MVDDGLVDDHRFTRVLPGEPAGALTVLGVSASRKPGPGSQARSASAGLLRIALARLGQALPDVGLLDLRDLELPFFDGRKLEEWQHPDVACVRRCIEDAASLVFAAPAYWQGVSGVFKNLTDILGGAHYDDPRPTTILAGKPFGLIVVGAEPGSAESGAEQARRTLAAMGAVEAAPAVVVANPRREPWDEEVLYQRLQVLVASVARAGIASEEAVA